MPSTKATYIEEVQEWSFRWSSTLDKQLFSWRASEGRKKKAHNDHKKEKKQRIREREREDTKQQHWENEMDQEQKGMQ